MKERFLNNCISFVKSNNIEIQEEELRYGLEGIYLTFGKLLIIFPLAFLLGIFKEFILTLIFFNIIRYPAFGIHANKSSTCLFSSILILVGIPLLMSKITITLPVKIATCIIAIIYSVIIIIFNNNDISIYLLSGMIIETILILPITYRIYGMPYRNYLMV